MYSEKSFNVITPHCAHRIVLHQDIVFQSVLYLSMPMINCLMSDSRSWTNTGSESRWTDLFLGLVFAENPMTVCVDMHMLCICRIRGRLERNVYSEFHNVPTFDYYIGGLWGFSFESWFGGTGCSIVCVFLKWALNLWFSCLHLKVLVLEVQPSIPWLVLQSELNHVWLGRSSSGWTLIFT